MEWRLVVVELMMEAVSLLLASQIENAGGAMDFMHMTCLREVFLINNAFSRAALWRSWGGTGREGCVAYAWRRMQPEYSCFCNTNNAIDSINVSMF